MKTLLKNAHIICDDKTVIKNGFIGIENETIIYVGNEKPTDKYDTEKDMSNKLIIPGIVNAHTHNPMTITRGVGSDLPLLTWLDMVMPIEDNFSDFDNMIGSRLAWMELLAGGVTSCSDMYSFPDCTMEDIANIGGKINIARGVLCFDENQSAMENDRVKESLYLYDTYNNTANGRIKVDFCFHAEYTNKEKIVREFSAMCKERNANLHIHLSESKKEHEDCIARYGKTPTKWFYDLGAFENPLMAAHCVQLTDEDIDIFKNHDTYILHNPTSNLKLGSGIAPIQKYLENGLNITLATDGAGSNNNLNMFEEMHLAAILHKGAMQNPTIVSPRDVFNMVTKNGAKMQKRADTGVLAVGKKADLAAIDLDKPHLIPHEDLFATLVYTAQASDVCMTMVDGKILYENGQFFTIDAEKTMAEFKESVGRLIHN